MYIGVAGKSMIYLFLICLPRNAIECFGASQFRGRVTANRMTIKLKLRRAAVIGIIRRARGCARELWFFIQRDDTHEGHYPGVHLSARVISRCRQLCF